MKKKNILVRIFCALLICCFGLMSISCGLSLDELLEIAGELVGWDEDDPSSGDNPGIDEALPADLYGSKVLYRPDDYDYDYGSGGADGSGEGENDYYGKYAYAIINNLLSIYGVSLNNQILKNRVPIFYNIDINNISSDEIYNQYVPYFYDSIRYKMDTVGTVTHYFEVNLDNNGNLELPSEINLDEIKAIPDGSEYQLRGANKNVYWNWTIPSYLGENNNLNPYIYFIPDDNTFVIDDNQHVYSNISNEEFDIMSYYADNIYFDSNMFQQIFLGTTSEIDYSNYSDFVKTLEYVIYCYAVDLEPAEVVVTQSGAYPYYAIRIGNFESVDSALETAKSTFEILGTYVGLVSRQITKIQNWILENIIGQDALNDNDYYYTYSPNTDGIGIVELTYNDEPVGYIFDYATRSTDTVGRDYETVVQNIVAGVCENVSIGKNDDDSDVTIDDRFLASNIMEYAGSTFTIQDDGNFPVYDPENPEHAYAIRPLEYQSVVLMFKQETYIDGLWLALKYDADGDGTEEDVYNWDEYIDIIIDLNYYNHATNTRRIIQSKKVRVYDGPYAIDYMYGFEGDTGGGGDGELVPRDHCSGVVFDDLGSLHVGVFNVDIGGGILKTDVGRNDYKGDPLVSLDPLVLVGTNNIRRYYEIVEPGSTDLDQEALEDGYTYTSGRLNPTMFSGSDGCDYIEITYKVIKEAGNMTKNYKFYTGLAYLDNDDEPSLY